MLEQHSEIDTTQTLIVNFNQFAGSSLDLLVYAFTHTTVWVKYHAVKQDVLIRSGQIIERHGAEIAFPTRTLHLHGAGVSPEPVDAAGMQAPGQQGRFHGRSPGKQREVDPGEPQA
jgi:MscS family membrane protein